MSVRRVITGIDMAWDGAVVHVPAGLIVSIEPGSVLEQAYGGPGNLETLDADAAPAVAATAFASN